MTAPDPRLPVLIKIKEARETAARQRLTTALATERQRREAEDRAQEHLDHCNEVADTYVRTRFAAVGKVNDIGRFIQGVALGNYGARRDASRARMVIERVTYRRTLATQDREDAARTFLAQMRSAEALRQVHAEQSVTADHANDIAQDEIMQELTAAGKSNDTAD